MSFDLSRIRFDARSDFLGVVMQQGRVQLDADWNEWVAQLGRRLQAGSLDTFGANVVPRITPQGFQIQATGGKLGIGPGRIYVDGLLAENHGAQPNAWEPRLAELTGTTAVDYAAQPYYPNPPSLPAGGPHLVYVDVWQRDISSLNVPDLVEKAVGVDTTGRLQTVWQVKLLANVGASSCATPDAEVPGWLAATAPSGARLSTDTGVPDFETNPCQVPPAAGYRGLENQLYRVEVHTAGALGTATFKWSRDNATVASRVTQINPARDRITVERIGHDDVLRFHDGDWVELIDDWLELHNLPGELRRIRTAAGVDETARTLQFDVALPAGLFPTDAQQATQPTRNTRVRRWDQSGQVRREDGTPMQDLNAPLSTGEISIPPAGTRVFLENGILVDFSLDPAAGQFNSGDYWVFAARTVDASVEKLDKAPALGIHHHYARLAVVDFPGNSTDCRTLWPPLADGEGCDCSVCVSAEGHNSGVATLQQAVDALKKTGGTICLGIGTYTLGAALNVDGAHSLRIRGQGWATLLVGSQPGSVIEIVSGIGVALENFSVIGSASGGGVMPMILASNTLDLRAEHINVLGLSVGDGRSAGIGLSGLSLGAEISECAIVAKRGVAMVAARDRNFLLSAELCMTRNLFIYCQRAVSFEGISLHYGNTRISGNLMITDDQAIVATGAVLPASCFDIVENIIHTGGIGIRAGIDGLRIRDNEITGQTQGSSDGIVLEPGLDPGALDDLKIIGNRLTQLQGNAVVINHSLDSARIVDNHIDGMGLGAVVMGKGGAAANLSVTGNHCRNLGVAVNDKATAFAAIQLVHVARGDLCDNVIANVARGASATPMIDAIRALACGQLRIAGNRLFAIGPDSGSGEMTAIQVLPPFDCTVIDNNHVDRIDRDGMQQPVLAMWRAINVAFAQAGTRKFFVPAYSLVVGEVAYLLTASHVYTFADRMGDLSIQGNQLRAHQTNVPLNQCTDVQHCLFAGNHCEVIGDSGKAPMLGQLLAHTLNASNNYLRGVGEYETLHLRTQVDHAIVIGNTSSGFIQVLNGAPIPNDIKLTNLFL
ncbi:TPA: right-handed parallel beta-helix repeat-containing protein [Pseudomonas putida]|nr:right-handed parallel beta-helix repeat-containing protein [Pseudomonas putida]